MKKNRLYLLLTLITFFGNVVYGKDFKSDKDVFGLRVFVENKGQFNSAIKSAEPVKYAYDSGLEHIYFTEKGLVYKLIKKSHLSEEQREKMEKGKKVSPKPDKIYYVNMNWIGSNENIQIVESEKQGYYFTYGGPELNSYGYKKITYKNVYDNVDIEYTIPEDKNHGIKYNIILHPGANPADIKISYSGDVDKIQKNAGEIIIKTPLEDITEHTPKSFYNDNTEVNSEFKLENKIISFYFPAGYDHHKTLVVDPWVTTIVNLLWNNYAYDVDYDYQGNLFVYGGNSFFKTVKYNSSGVMLWVFSGNIPAIPWDSDGGFGYVGNFVVNKITGKTYIGTGAEWTGTRIIRLDATGNYDNFVTTPVVSCEETWDMGFNCATNSIYSFGGGTYDNTNAGSINQLNGTLVPSNFSNIFGIGEDLVSHAIDDNGNIFVYLVASIIPSADNKIIRVNPAFNGNTWLVASTYTSFTENIGNKAAYVGANALSNGFNCLAVNNSYLFMYDGFNLAAYNKNTGIKIAFTTIPGQTVLQQGGIVVDDCNNLYLGGNGNIKCYNFNGNIFSALPNIPLGIATPYQYVYDIKLDKYSNLLYVCGSGFAGTYSAAVSNGCSATAQFGLVSNCNGNNIGTGVASLTTNIVNPQINYIWTGAGGTVSATYSTGATSNTVSLLPNGTYTVQMQINAPCGPIYTNTILINCCVSYTLIPTVVQTNCTNTLNSVSLNLVGAGTLTPTYTWSPVPAALAGNSLSATGLPAGITTISALAGPGCLVTLTLNILPPPPPLTFTINNLSGSNSITCINPVINLAAVTNYTSGPLTYFWSSPSFTANTPTVSISSANSLTVTLTDPATGCVAAHTIAIGMNTTVPTNSVAPLSQAITCNSVVAVTFSGTVTNPTVNVLHEWYSPLNPLPGGVPIASSNNTISLLTGSLSPGVYTLQTTNLVNGCKAYKTVTVTSLDAWPSFGVNSTTNFSVGCSPLNQTTLSIINPISTQTPPATCSFTFLPPGYAGTLIPGPFPGGNSSTVTTLAGTWTLIVNDNSNNCRTILSVPIVQNTIAPNVAVDIITQTLTCKNPTLLATGTSSTPNTVISWDKPIAPPSVPVPTIIVGPGTGPNTSTTSLSYASYTVVATNSINACISTSVIIISQNFKLPVSSPTLSSGTPLGIYCNAAANPAILTTGASAPGSGVPNAFAANPCWAGPAPQVTLCGTSSYSAYIAGIYSLTIEDSYNGCTKTNTYQVFDKTQPPVITNPADSSILDCGSGQAALQALITGTTTGFKYWYYNYPPGAAFNPTAATVPNGANPNLSGTTSSLVSVSLPGLYQYVVTNTLTGCRAFGAFRVVNGNINASFTPDILEGYAPLTVNFTNNSSTSLNSQSITSIWSFGNGISQTTSANNNTSAQYNSPGTYTVLLISSKGTCLDTAYRIIKVELPSKLEIPNIFTPNGDGSNDVFFLKTANLGEITAVIFDRWGNKVYDVTSSTGNIAWDGKNLMGQDCAPGVYFYVVKASGKDGKNFETKGNVSLFR